MCELQSGKPFLGICLGLQLLFEGSTESGGVEGLSIVPGAIAEFDRSKGLPVPHIGWNSLQERQAFYIPSPVALPLLLTSLTVQLAALSPSRDESRCDKSGFWF